ncbi:MAG: PAS domain S-box protein [Bacteroidota bacterium]
MNSAAGINFQQLFESAPGLYLILQPDLTIVAVSDAYLKATMTKREQILGRGIFDVFPDNPDDPGATGVSNLRASLNYVLQNREVHTMAVQQYDIRRPDGNFEERYWSPLNKPLFNEKNEIAFIIHRVEDVTAFVQIKKEEARQLKLTEELRGQVQEMEMEIYKRAQEIQNVNSRLLDEMQKSERSQQELKASQLMFSTIFYQSPIMNTIADAATGKYIEVNDNFARFCGFTKEEIIGKSSLELNLMPQFRKRTEMINRLKKDGYALDVLMEAIDKDGNLKWISTSAHTVSINGRDCFLTAMTDITERKNTEETLKAKEELISKQKQEIQDFIDSMSTLCAKVTTDGKLLMVNKPALKATGLSMEELLNTNFLEGNWWTYNVEVNARVREAFAKACQGIPVNYDENIFVFGQVLPINFSLIPILGLQNSVEYIVAEGRDISSLKQTETALQKQTEELEMANKELEAFSYSVSHDLRAPLRIMHGYTEIIISDYSDKLEDEGKRMLGIVTSNVRKMGQLIDDLLNLSRLGRKELSFQHINMNKLVESVIEEVNISVAKRPLMHTGHLLPVQSDNSLLRQVWINLISNAVKYSRTKEQPSIEINSMKTGNEIVYSIKDNGVGFNMKYSNKLFGVFQRLHKANEFEGTGVGLALVHRIISRLGGKVWAEAELNKGATFWFSLPERQPAVNEKQKELFTSTY